MQRDTCSLYVNELSPDKVKAVVSDTTCIRVNILLLRYHLFNKDIFASLGKAIDGVLILPVGKYICMITGYGAKPRSANGIILLDLIGREEIGHKISEKFDNKALEERFMDVLCEVVGHPEDHSKFTLVVGKPPSPFLGEHYFVDPWRKK
jgi:hypothetical protein